MENRWLPMVTAPKDGTEILLFLGEPYYRIEKARWFEKWGNWINGNTPDGWDEYYGIGSEVPIFWMPLPDPPTQTKDK